MTCVGYVDEHTNLDARVVACKAIIKGKTFCIARPGDAGRAVMGASPHDEENYGKVMVMFDGATRGYWCDPKHLRFRRGVDPKDYIAVKPSPDEPYKDTLAVPKLKLKLGRSPVVEYHFGHNLKVLRQARQMSQNDLGRVMGKYGQPAAQSTICYRESRQYGPNGKFIDAAAKALQVPVCVFFLDLKDCTVFDRMKKFMIQMSSSVCEANNVGVP